MATTTSLDVLQHHVPEDGGLPRAGLPDRIQVMPAVVLHQTERDFFVLLRNRWRIGEK
jgi:hypothetical protein